MLHVTCSLRFISGVTPGDLLAVRRQWNHSLPCTCKQGLETGTYRAAAQCETRQMLYRLSYAGYKTLRL